MLLEVLKYTSGIAAIGAVVWFILKFFILAPKQLKDHERKHESHEAQFKEHSLKITTLEANDKNREKTVDRIHETLIMLNNSIIKLTKKL